jgi:23S rRNA pseudouridine1911/1915/1917 synthase
LDNETAGLLYFASTADLYQQYKQQQEIWSIDKWYIADVVGRVRSAFGSIESVIEHHPDDDRRMRIAELGSVWLTCQTQYEVIDFDQDRQQTTVMIRITKWVRHQIRAHLHSLGHPIVGDSLYINKALRKNYDKNWLLYQDSYLHLRSIGVSLNV